MSAGHRDGLALAEEELRKRPPPRMDITSHPMSYAALSELYAERDKQQREAAQPAA